MKLNANLSRIFNLRHKYSEYANSMIENFWDSRPEIDETTFDGMSNAHDVSVQSVGYYNGMIGTWNTTMSIDENKQISKLRLTFSTDHNSKTPYFDTFSLSLSGISPTTPFWTTSQNLIDFTQSRVYNYRKMEIDHPLTVAEIKKISKPVTVAKFTLSAKKTADSKNYSTYASETFGFGCQSGLLSSETPEEIEA